MLVGVNSPFSFLDSNVIDETPTLEDILLDGQSPLFSDGMELRDSETVFSYKGDEYRPRVWNQDDQDAGKYEMDEILYTGSDIMVIAGQIYDAGSLIKVTGKDADDFKKHERPYEPEEYLNFDTDVLKWGEFSHRYLRVAVEPKGSGVKDKRTWEDKDRYYYFFMDKKACGDSKWRWSALDRNSACQCNANAYLRSCMQYSHKYEAGKDIKATHPNWAGIGSYKKLETYQFKSMIERGGYLYFRTHINSKIKYKDWTTGAYKYHYMAVISPGDIPGFKERRKTNSHSPFDGKSYTRAVVDTSKTGGAASWTLLSTDEFNTIAFGSINTASISISIKDIDGIEIFAESNYQVDNTVDDITELEEYVTRTIHIPKMIPSECKITIKIIGDVIEIGEIKGAKSIDAGFTNMKFSHKLKDFSPKEQDDWGNWYYTPGIKVYTHRGTVELPIVRYDQMAKLMKLIGGGTVVINSSDSFENEAPDNRNVFGSTMMIARFINLELSTKMKDKRIGELAEYSFTLEEII